MHSVAAGAGSCSVIDLLAGTIRHRDRREVDPAAAARWQSRAERRTGCGGSAAAARSWRPRAAAPPSCGGRARRPAGRAAPPAPPCPPRRRWPRRPPAHPCCLPPTATCVSASLHSNCRPQSHVYTTILCHQIVSCRLYRQIDHMRCFRCECPKWSPPVAPLVSLKMHDPVGLEPLARVPGGSRGLPAHADRARMGFSTAGFTSSASCTWMAPSREPCTFGRTFSGSDTFSCSYDRLWCETVCWVCKAAKTM